MTEMKHVSTQDISDFLDGTLSVARMRDTAIHIDGCEPCSTELEAWKKTRAMLRRAPKSVAPSPDFWAATTARLIEEDRAIPQASRLSFQTVLIPGRRFELKDAVPAGQRLSFKTVGPSISTRMAAFTSMAAAIVGVAFMVGHWPGMFAVVPGIPNTNVSTMDTIDNDDLSSFVRAHTEAAAAQPFADGSRQIMLAADLDDPSDTSAGDTTTDADANL